LRLPPQLEPAHQRRELPARGRVGPVLRVRRRPAAPGEHGQRDRRRGHRPAVTPPPAPEDDRMSPRRRLPAALATAAAAVLMTPRSKGAASGGGNPPGWFPLPTRFADKESSGVTTTVRGGSNTFNIDLK